MNYILYSVISRYQKELVTRYHVICECSHANFKQRITCDLRIDDYAKDGGVEIFIKMQCARIRDR